MTDEERSADAAESMSANDATALSAGLPAISPERAAATTRLLAAGDVLVRADGGTRLELRNAIDQQVPHSVVIELTHANGTIDLVIIEESGTAAVGDRLWHDFTGDEKLLAWALTYETLVSELSALLGTSLLPVRIDAARIHSHAIWHWLEWRFEAAENTHCRGLIGLDRGAVEAVAGATGWTRTKAHEGRAGRDVPLSCHVAMQSLVLPGDVMRHLTIGDVVLLGARSVMLASLRLRIDNIAALTDVQGAWAVAVVPDGISLTRALTRAEIRSETMTPETPPNAEQQQTDPLEAIDVRVEVVLDTFGMTLAQIDRLSAGQILPLTQSVDHARVTLRANGRQFGSGELVSLGDTLGVKLVRIGESSGLQ